jgi:Reverse transcriptase (RNA-dependent DNA polymerase)
VRSKVSINDVQFGFRPGMGTTDAIFIVRQIQERFLKNKRNLWMAFVDLEKAFEGVPREVIWWALRYLGVEDWMVTVIRAMYEGVTTAVKMKDERE